MKVFQLQPYTIDTVHAVTYLYDDDLREGDILVLAALGNGNYDNLEVLHDLVPGTPAIGAYGNYIPYIYLLQQNTNHDQSH